MYRGTSLIRKSQPLKTTLRWSCNLDISAVKASSRFPCASPVLAQSLHVFFFRASTKSSYVVGQFHDETLKFVNFVQGILLHRTIFDSSIQVDV